MCLTEHWMKQSEIEQLCIMNFQLISAFCRTERIHGGSCIYVHNSIVALEIDSVKLFSVEMHIEIAAVSISKHDLIVISIYRPPSGCYATFLDTMCKTISFLRDYCGKILLVGDLNIDLLKDSQRKKQLTDLLLSYNLNSLIKFATRTQKLSATCLDHAYSNIDGDMIDATPMYTNISDHDGQLVSIKILRKSGTKNRTQMKRLITPLKLANFQTALSNYEWDSILLSDESPDQKFNRVAATFANLFYTHFPCRRYPVKKSDIKWINDEIINLKTLLVELKALNSRLSSDIDITDQINKFEDYYSNLVLENRHKYFDNKINKSSNTVKTIWILIKDETCKTPKNQLEHIDLQTNGLAEVFNEYFVNTARSCKISTDKIKAIQYLNNFIECPPQLNSFKPITIYETYKIIRKIKNKTTKDYNDIPTSLLKKLPPVFVDILCYLANKCIECGVYPTCLKDVKVVPVYKGKGKKSEIKNYRPISIIPVFSKILELGIADQLLGYFKSNALLSSQQYAYQRGKSTTLATRHLVKTVLDSLEERKQTALILCDLSRAFDLVDHDLILRKLQHYGLGGACINLLRSFLAQRRQAVEVAVEHGTSRSSFRDLGNLSIPQGSVLGNYLFLILVNDLAMATKSAELVAFADDSAFLVSADTKVLLQNQIQKSITDIKDWFQANGMILNLEKTNIINFNLRGKSDGVPFTCDGIQIPNISHAKYLGFVLDSGLKWDMHIDYLCDKLSKACFAISRLVTMLSASSVKSAYYAYFQSLLSYGIDLWGQAADRQRVFVLQKRVLRQICRVPWDTPARPLFIDQGILTMPSLYILEVSKFVKSNLDSFQTNKNAHQRNTRNKDKLVIGFKRLKKSSQSVWNEGPKIYNKINKSIREIESYELFVTRLKEFLLKKAYYSIEEYLNDKLMVV